MKRKIILLLMALVLAVSASVSASPKDRDDPNDRGQHKKYDQHDQRDRHDKWQHPTYRSDKWQPARHEVLPFAWHERRDRIYKPGATVERVFDREWNNRFPGLQAYRWHDNRGQGFWYQGHRIDDAVMFYNDDDELVSIGFMHNGLFLFIRDDDNGFENHDSFFISWWSR